MPGKLRLVAALAVAAGLLAIPAFAQATLVFVRNPLKPVVYAAADNGSGVYRVGPGRSPRVSPDGQTIAYVHEGSGNAQELMLAPVGGGPPKKLATGWRDPFVFAWSPDSTTVAVLLGPEIGKQRLTTIAVATGAQHTIARGFFSGASFSPQGSEQLVYAKTASEGFPLRSDIYRVDILPPGAVSVAAEHPHRLTTDHRSTSPLWGPSGKIVFVKLLGAKQRKYGPKNELYLMSPNGSQVKRLTHTKVDPLLQGLYPTEWSADGKRLLAEFEGQDTSYAVTVNPQTGAQRPLTKEREQGFVGTALSKDGQTVLGFTGGFEPGPAHDVSSIPYAGGKAKVLVKNASEPDWSN